MKGSVFVFLSAALKLIVSRAGAQIPNPGEEARILFLTHCASCHGENGKGNGVVSAAMKIPPADLTQISKRRGGQFPYDEVRNLIVGLKLERVHGPRAMPVWGRVVGVQTLSARPTIAFFYFVSDHNRTTIERDLTG